MVSLLLLGTGIIKLMSNKNRYFRGSSLPFHGRARLRIKTILLCVGAVFIACSLPDRLRSSGIRSVGHVPLDLSVNLKRDTTTLATFDPEVPNGSVKDLSPRGISSPPSKIEKRVMTFGQAVDRGNALLCAVMNYNAQLPGYPPQSPWTDPEDLLEYGWEAQEYPVPGDIFLTVLEPTLVSLGLSTDVGDWASVSDCHVNPYRVEPDGDELPPTGAHFAAMYNGDQGAIIVLNTESPSNTERVEHDNYPIPPISKLSDDLFLNWFTAAGPDPGSVAGLKYYIQVMVRNADSEAIINRFAPLAEWPGQEFPISGSDEDGLALLGTPNGMSLAYLLSQHKDYFPQKTISKVTIWQAVPPHDDNEPPDDPWINMLFYITDIPTE